MSIDIEVVSRTMKLLIAGSRDIFPTHREFLDIFQRALIPISSISEIVSGKAKGVDARGELLAETYDIHVEPFPANWILFGKRAGHVRNEQMVKYCDMTVLIWDGESPGTKNMIENLDKLNKEYYLQKRIGTVMTEQWYWKIW